jgi:hypothetical protein
MKRPIENYQPIHEDKNLNIEWWLSRDFKFGSTDKRFEIYVNAVRDGSGRYDGFYINDKKNKTFSLMLVRTVERAELILNDNLLGQK